MKALVLSGGGARGAYQAGVLTAIADICRGLKIKQPFQILTGVSAGAINTAFLASQADDFIQASHQLANMWKELNSSQVFKTDVFSLGKLGLKWMGDLSLGGMTGPVHGRSLLDTSPLADLLKNNLSFQQIQDHLTQGQLTAVAITALEYGSSETITFIQTSSQEQNAHSRSWKRAFRRSEPSQLSSEHIMASSAIPLLFPSIPIGNRYFGDGCIRNHAPCSPALHLGADQLLVIGVRSDLENEVKNEASGIVTSDKTNKPDKPGKTGKTDMKAPPSVAQVANTIINAVLLDGVELDIERIRRINNLIQKVPETHHKELGFKHIDCVWVHPSEEIGAVAAEMTHLLPRMVRYLMKGLGPLEDAREIVSYLMFEGPYLNRLIEIGYQDGMHQRNAIENFLNSGPSSITL